MRSKGRVRYIRDRRQEREREREREKERARERGGREGDREGWEVRMRKTYIETLSETDQNNSRKRQDVCF